MRVGVVGLGVMGSNHARVLAEMESVSFVGLFDPRGKEIGQPFGLPVESNFERFLGNNFDYCVLSSPTSTHLEVALKLTQQRIPTLIEKPMALSSAEGREMVDAFLASNTVGAVGHIERFNPAIVGLKEALDSGQIGNTLQISTVRIGPYTGRIKDVGVVTDLATHDIDLALWLSGSEYDNLNCYTYDIHAGPHEDLMNSIGNLSNGTIVSHSANWISPFKVRTTSVLGESGLIVADTIAGDFTIYKNKTSQDISLTGGVFPGPHVGEMIRPEVIKVEPLIEEHKAFQKLLSNSSPVPIASLNEGLRVLEVVEKMLHSEANAD